MGVAPGERGISSGLIAPGVDGGLKREDLGKGEAQPGPNAPLLTGDAALDAYFDGDATGEAATDAAVDGSDTFASTTMLSLSLPLVPAFSSSIHDYYVRCGGGTNYVDVSMTAAPGSTVELLQPVTTPPAIKSSIAVGVNAGAAIVVGVTTGGAVEQYWVRCLPPTFPPIAMTPHPDVGTPTPGYYLVGNYLAPPAGECYAMVLDGNGVPVWYESTESAAFDVDSLAGGAISYSVFPPSPPAVGDFQIDLVAGTTSYVEPPGAPLDPHELRLLPNGDYLVLANPLSTDVDLSGLESFGASENVLGCLIQEVDGTGAAVWQWDAMDHFDPALDSTAPEPVIADGVNAIDVFHCNSIDVAASGDLLVSARNMDSIFLIEKATGAVTWKMGGARYSTDGASYISVLNDPQTSFHRQHDARLQPDGTLSMFDDQTGLPGPSRAVVYSYDVSAGTASLVWQYESTTVAADMGSFRILGDGSRVVGWGMVVGGSATFSEVTEAGEDLLDFSLGSDNASYRAVKVPTSALDVAALRSATGR